MLENKCKAPVPGGCSLTFDNELAPYLITSVTRDLIIIDSQPPSMYGYSCDKNDIKVEMYHMYLEEYNNGEKEYFDGINKMLTVDDIRKNGELVTKDFKQSPYRRMFSAYWGIGKFLPLLLHTAIKVQRMCPLFHMAVI